MVVLGIGVDLSFIGNGDRSKMLNSGRLQNVEFNAGSNYDPLSKTNRSPYAIGFDHENFTGWKLRHHKPLIGTIAHDADCAKIDLDVVAANGF
ncbi:Hypothetical Protein FCC1311_034432 [Hondaea fermentalgiana]|uniref:Uncharacterized protein n=1 Tax=Hondaea fermentalgiana TaxID=2315210 RepID=A0A2R5GG51_9STRA|nr:Hypothetical Protein FCC1311_034432 [Hondaea fermentalgiana]|eukprot:GBG27221.1 Hypothetical Protein FCC1311_034432 [Hondaea fermentalgiana]